MQWKMLQLYYTTTHIDANTFTERIRGGGAKWEEGQIVSGTCERDVPFMTQTETTQVEIIANLLAHPKQRRSLFTAKVEFSNNLNDTFVV